MIDSYIEHGCLVHSSEMRSWQNSCFSPSFFEVNVLNWRNNVHARWRRKSVMILYHSFRPCVVTLCRSPGCLCMTIEHSAFASHRLTFQPQHSFHTCGGCDGVPATRCDIVQCLCFGEILAFRFETCFCCCMGSLTVHNEF